MRSRRATRRRPLNPCCWRCRPTTAPSAPRASASRRWSGCPPPSRMPWPTPPAGGLLRSRSLPRSWPRRSTAARGGQLAEQLRVRSADARDTDVSYVDPSSGRRYPLTEARWCGDDGHYLNLGPGSGLGRDDIDPGRDSVWRYAKALLVDAADAVSMGEGWTPLVAAEWGGATVLFKLEFLMPTGSFKDRGMTVMVSYLRRRGV